jgi:hypothetical protein
MEYFPKKCSSFIFNCIEKINVAAINLISEVYMKYPRCRQLFASLFWLCLELI